MFALVVLSCATAIPYGFSTWFYAQQCPQGWTSLSALQGRLVVSVVNGSTSGLMVGSPLADQEDRQHVHTFNANVQLPEKEVSAIDCCNDEGACNGAYTSSSKTDGGASGLPFAQLLFCTWLSNDTSGAVPAGTIGFFPNLTANSTVCPSGWQAYQTANGRFIIPGYSASGTVESQAPPLSSGELRAHSHTISTTLTTNSISYAGIAGCCNKNVAQDGTYPITGSSAAADTGVPYIQLLTCVSLTQTFDSAFPKGTLLFNQVACTTGWDVSVEAPGRYLVSLPDGAVPGASFGGKSIPPNFAGPVNSSHTFQGTVETHSCGVGLASGCCADGFVENHSYSYAGTTSIADTGLPFLAVPQCLQLGDLELLRQIRSDLEVLELNSNELSIAMLKEFVARSA